MNVLLLFLELFSQKSLSYYITLRYYIIEERVGILLSGEVAMKAGIIKSKTQVN